MSDEELLEHIQERLASGDDVYVRILTRQEMIDKGLIYWDDDRPSHWNSRGAMDGLFGETVRVIAIAVGVNAKGITIGRPFDTYTWFIKEGYFELINDTPSEGNTKVTLDDIKDFINNKLNKG